MLRRYEIDLVQNWIWADQTRKYWFAVKSAHRAGFCVFESKSTTLRNSSHDESLHHIAGAARALSAVWTLVHGQLWSSTFVWNHAIDWARQSRPGVSR